MTITVLTKENCQQCRATERFLTSKGVAFNIAPASDRIEELASLGFTSAPVVLVEEGGSLVDSWSGFRPDSLSKYSG